MPELRLVGLPNGDVAVGLAGKKAKSRGPRRTKAERDAARNAKRANQAAARVDADLSRAVDAVAFLARNEVDPATLIARISPTEAEAVGANLRKAVDWLNRFADGWHVFIGNFEAEGASSGTSIEAGRRGGIRLVRCRD
jgi:hypothetical protein